MQNGYYILDLSMNIFPILNADVSTSVGSCDEGDIRLVGGANVTIGRIEVCINNAWGTVCNNRFGTNEALVICRQLGYSDTSKYSQFFFLILNNYAMNICRSTNHY